MDEKPPRRSHFVSNSPSSMLTYCNRSMLARSILFLIAFACQCPQLMADNFGLDGTGNCKVWLMSDLPDGVDPEVFRY